MAGLGDFTNCPDEPYNHTLWCEGHQEVLILWACIGGVGFVLGFPAAVAVLWEILQRGRRGGQITPYDIFVFNATIIDGLYLLCTVPEVCNYLYAHSCEFEQFLVFVFPINLSGRPLFTTCICVDCYLAVVHPVVYHSNKSLTPRVLISAGIWTLTLLHGLILVKYFDLIDLPVDILFFALSLLIIGFCDITIYKTLRQPNPAGGVVHPKKKRARQVIINNLVITFTSFLPPIIGVFLSNVLNLDGLTTQCHVMLIVLNSIIVGNAVSPILCLNNLGKLDWLKFLCRNKPNKPYFITDKATKYRLTHGKPL